MYLESQSMQSKMGKWYREMSWDVKVAGVILTASCITFAKNDPPLHTASQ